MVRSPGFLRGRGRAFLADAGGLAAIELALILPFAAMLMSLVVFGGQAYSVQRRVTLAATTVANIFAQANNTNSSTITAAELSQILAYPNLILYPYSSTGVAVEVSQLLVTVNGNGTATGTVKGSWANANGTVRPTGQQLSIDPSIAAAFSGTGNNYVVLGEVQYPFQPTGLYFSVSTMTLHDSIIMIPRVASPITVHGQASRAATSAWSQNGAFRNALRAPPVRLKRGRAIYQQDAPSVRTMARALRAKRSNPGDGKESLRLPDCFVAALLAMMRSTAPPKQHEVPKGGH